MDFIIALPILRSGMNVILIVTDKFTKWIKLMLGKDKYIARKWIIILLRLWIFLIRISGSDNF
jgi:hypothetical protein